MVFFNPTDEFVDWLVDRARDRIVIDVGCGEGALLTRLIDRNVKALGIEILPYATSDTRLITRIMPVDAEKCSSLQTIENALVLFCRPCHGGFVGRTMCKINPNNEVLYIGLKKNIMDDLQGFTRRIVDAPRGAEREVVRQVLLPRPVIREHNEWFRTVSLGNRKSCPECRTRLDERESVWSWGEYAYGKWRTVRYFCKHCFKAEVQKRLLDHAGPCGCKINLVGKGDLLPDWLTLDCPVTQSAAKPKSEELQELLEIASYVGQLATR